jgi:hypothetical protein
MKQSEGEFWRNQVLKSVGFKFESCLTLANFIAAFAGDIKKSNFGGVWVYLA